MNGKGSAPRPMSVTREEYRRRHDATFGRGLTMDTHLRRGDFLLAVTSGIGPEDELSDPNELMILPATGSPRQARRPRRARAARRQR
jgi:hypothetical protein